MNADEKKALIEFLKFLVEGSAGQHKQIYEIALAALTAQPDAWKQRAEAAEAKLAELEGQEPRYQIQKKPSYGRESVWIDVATREEAETNVLHGYRWRTVYDAPAPAVSLAELVPGKCSMADYYENIRSGDVEPEEAGILMWDACRAAILRNIDKRETAKPAAPEVE